MRLKPVNIVRWAAWAPNIETEADWLAWSQEPVTPYGEQPIKTKTIPPMLKRRCSKLSRMTLEMASKAMGADCFDYAVFCSQHSDLDRSATVIQDICDQEPLSPSIFSQSVHNASAGIFSIIHKLHQNMTFIAAGKHTFFMGMIEALCWLQLHADNSVLVTMSDAYIAKMFQPLNIVNNNEYALSLLLTNKETHTSPLSVSLDYIQVEKRQPMLPALEFLAWLIQVESATLQQTSSHQTLIWRKA